MALPDMFASILGRGRGGGFDVIGTLTAFYQLAFLVVRFVFLLLAVSFLLGELLLVSFVLPRGVGTLVSRWYGTLYIYQRSTPIFDLFGWVILPCLFFGLVVIQSGSWSK